MARIKEEATKLQASRCYNTKVQPRAFQPEISYVESEAKPEKICEQESLDPTEKAHSGLYQT